MDKDLLDKVDRFSRLLFISFSEDEEKFYNILGALEDSSIAKCRASKWDGFSNSFKKVV